MKSLQVHPYVYVNIESLIPLLELSMFSLESLLTILRFFFFLLRLKAWFNNNLSMVKNSVWWISRRLYFSGVLHAPKSNALFFYFIHSVVY